MPSTTPAFQQSGFATSQFGYPILLNDLNSNDRSFLKTLIRKYGTENYGMWQLLMGQTATYENTDNKQYYHYEKRELHSSLSVANTVGATGAGNAITFLVGADSYYAATGSCPARVGEEGIVDSSGIAVQISAIPATTANAWQVTLIPLNTTDNIASIGGASLLSGDSILFRGRIDVGEASTTGSGIAPVYDKIYNTTTEHRDDFTLSDFAVMEKQEVMLVDGQQYYMPLAVDDMNKRYMNQMFWKVLEANGASNLAANGTYGTIGVQPRVAANGSTIQYTAGNPLISDFQTMGRALNFFGSPGEYHLLNDFYSKQGISNLLETFYKGTFNHAQYESVGGSKESGGAYGFDTFRADNITYHMTVNPMYNTEMVYKRVPQASTGSIYRNYSLAIPQRINQDPKMRDGDGNAVSYPSFQVVFQKSPVDGNRIYTWEYGGAAPQNKTGTLNRTISMQSYYGVRVIAPVQFALFQGK
jgi:hypothetical protein